MHHSWKTTALILTANTLVIIKEVIGNSILLFSELNTRRFVFIETDGQSFKPEFIQLGQKRVAI